MSPKTSRGWWERPLPDLVGSVLGLTKPRHPIFVLPADPQTSSPEELSPCTALAEINSHPLDARIRFEPNGHVYFFDEKKIDTSASCIYFALLGIDHFVFEN